MIKEIRIEVHVHVDKKGWVFYYLTSPWIPDGCERCGIYKGSSFETKITQLIAFHDQSSDSVPFFCADCYKKIFLNRFTRRLYGHDYKNK